jgi:hypothetical protein
MSLHLGLRYVVAIGDDICGQQPSGDEVKNDPYCQPERGVWYGGHQITKILVK